VLSEREEERGRGSKSWKEGRGGGGNGLFVLDEPLGDLCGGRGGVLEGVVPTEREGLIFGRDLKVG